MIDLRTPSVSSPSTVQQTNASAKDTDLKLNRTLMMSIRQHKPDSSLRSNSNSHRTRLVTRDSMEDLGAFASSNSRRMEIKLSNLPSLERSKQFSSREGVLQEFSRRSVAKSSDNLVKEILGRYQRHYKPKNCSLSPEKRDNEENARAKDHSRLQGLSRSTHIPTELKQECDNIKATIASLHKVELK